MCKPEASRAYRKEPFQVGLFQEDERLMCIRVYDEYLYAKKMFELGQSLRDYDKVCGKVKTYI